IYGVVHNSDYCSHGNTFSAYRHICEAAVDCVMALANGVYDSIDIALFIFVLGGMLAYMNKSGAFTAGMGALTKITRGKEYPHHCSYLPHCTGRHLLRYV
ncbi:MAG: hypothetical protein MST07_10240, partial [Firmicutes bacterium]|nr:hypothetical protein [Bacillota bacterium]